MDKNDLKRRYMHFALRIIRLADSLPNNVSGRAIANQIVRSGTSPGANYHSACHAKSDKDFLNKLKMVEEELDETLYWIELLVESNIVKKEDLTELLNENQELYNITVSAIKTVRSRLSKDSKPV